MSLLRLHFLRLPLTALTRRQQQRCVRTYVTTKNPTYPTLNEEEAGAEPPQRDKLDELLLGTPPPAPAETVDVNNDDFFSDGPPVAPPGLLPEQQSPSSSNQKSKNNKPVASAHALPSHELFSLHVKSSHNNTILTLSDMAGNPRCWVSSGSCGFKKVQRSSYEAGYQCAVHMFQRIAQIKEDTEMIKLEVIFKGFGQGREAVFRALTTSEGDAIRDIVCRFRDVTPIRFGGTKAKKRRRL